MKEIFSRNQISWSATWFKCLLNRKKSLLEAFISTWEDFLWIWPFCQPFPMLSSCPQMQITWKDDAVLLLKPHMFVHLALNSYYFVYFFVILHQKPWKQTQRLCLDSPPVSWCVLTVSHLIQVLGPQCAQVRRRRRMQSSCAANLWWQAAVAPSHNNPIIGDCSAAPPARESGSMVTGCVCVLDDGDYDTTNTCPLAGSSRRATAAG